ncbi:GNAT family N-acetyltransferase [[Clostridium] fimetarium]|uniref:Ribosomal-protein-alanine N-acetyltransferase n=1 Tax=[Clostridium] fimetarium TaxID=99656 RepID=A0A1I0RXL8_9FIRM|nr:GNAT family protein [[Clostridium] fimetarium]SEW46339.1 ribosomal-protein-alanine N-acetyltransferase [[Clostridium] fimetarium]
MEIELKKWCSTYKFDLIKLCNDVDRSWIYRAILHDGKLIGNISIEKKHDVFEKDAEIGYMMSAEKYDYGYTTIAISHICEIAFNELDLKRITGLVYEPNKASRRVLEKNKFVLEGIMKDAVYKNGNTYNLCIYGKYF